jgi:hypothetical protein
MGWNLEDNSLQPNEVLIYKYLKTNCNTRVAENVLKLLSLSSYLKDSHFSSAEELRTRILNNGKPIFTKKEAESLYEKKFSGGGAADAIGLVVANFLYRWMPLFATRFIDTWQPTAMILKELTQDPAYGPIIDTALNMMTAAIPVSVEAIETTASEVGGPAGAVIGYGFGSMAAVLGILTHISKEEFGEAFILMAPLIPFIGLSLHSLLQSGVRFIDKTLDKKEKFLEMIRYHFRPEVADLVNEIINDWTNPPPNPRPLIQKVQGLVPPQVTRAYYAVKNANDSLAPIVTSALEHVTNIAEAIPPAVEAIKGIRLSGGKHFNSKWRTQRRSRQ